MPHSCGGTQPAEVEGMIRTALLVTTIASLTACIGRSRTPGRVGGALLAIGGVAWAYDGGTDDCGSKGLGCGIGAGMQIQLGTMLAIAGVTTLLINELRYLPPADDEDRCKGCVVHKGR
jgi:hypothetical protein